MEIHVDCTHMYKYMKTHTCTKYIYTHGRCCACVIVLLCVSKHTHVDITLYMKRELTVPGGH